MSDGSVKTKTYDLLGRLGDDAPGATHLSNLADLRDYIIARIDSEVIGL